MTRGLVIIARTLKVCPLWWLRFVLANKEDILGCHKDIGQLSKDQVGLALCMTGFEAQVCHCGLNSGRLSDMLYEEPPVASGSGDSFHGGESPGPVPIPPPSAPVLAENIPVPSSGLSSLDKECHELAFFTFFLPYFS